MYEQSINLYYGEEHDFDQSTVDLADSYALVFVNERSCYELIKQWFNDTSNTDINTSFPYKNDYTRKEYLSCLNRVTVQRDKSNFAALCRMVIWNHYSELYSLRQIRILVKKPVEQLSYEKSPFQTLNSEEFWKEIDNHTDNANQHLRNVENEMNTLTKFKDEVTKTVTLIHGKPVEDYTEAELVELIRKARQSQQDISDLVDTSKRMKERHEQLAKDILVYTEALDKLPS